LPVFLLKGEAIKALEQFSGLDGRAAPGILLRV
jgi:hypothetical protein